MALDPVVLDDLTWDDFSTAALLRIPAASGGRWTLNAPVDPGITLVDLFGWLLEQRVYWMDQVSDPLTRALLKLMGITPNPAVAATTVLHVPRWTTAVTLTAGGAGSAREVARPTRLHDQREDHGVPIRLHDGFGPVPDAEGGSDGRQDSSNQRPHAGPISRAAGPERGRHDHHAHARSHRPRDWSRDALAVLRHVDPSRPRSGLVAVVEPDAARWAEPINMAYFVINNGDSRPDAHERRGRHERPAPIGDCSCSQSRRSRLLSRTPPSDLRGHPSSFGRGLDHSAAGHAADPQRRVGRSHSPADARCCPVHPGPGQVVASASGQRDRASRNRSAGLREHAS